MAVPFHTLDLIIPPNQSTLRSLTPGSQAQNSPPCLILPTWSPSTLPPPPKTSVLPAALLPPCPQPPLISHTVLDIPQKELQGEGLTATEVLGLGGSQPGLARQGGKQSASFLLVPFLTTSSQMLDSMHKTSTPGRRRAKGSWGQSEQLCSCELPHPGLVPSPLPAQESSHPAAFTSSAPSLTQPISFQSLWPLDRLRLSPLGPEWTSSLQTVKIKQKGDQEGRCPEQTKPLKPGWHGVWG